MRLEISYDGRDHSGWARQDDLRTVQGELERVFAQVLRVPVRITCAGRTDAGVHARGQVAHLDVALTQWDPRWDLERMNRALPHDIRVWAIDPAPPGFDARFSALWRRYTYRVCDDPRGPDPLDRHVAMPWFRRLNVDAMNAAARPLVGIRDFSAFCKQRDRATSVREVQELRWERDPRGLAVMTIQADAFCRSMVRSLVGAMLPVGDGRKPVEWTGEVLNGRERIAWVTVAPAYPLVLEAVGYPPDAELLARQDETRSHRVVPPRDPGAGAVSESDGRGVDP